MVDLIINPRSKNLKKIKCDTDANTKVQAIIDEYSRVNNINPNRIRLSYLSGEEDPKTKKNIRVALKNDQTLAQNGLEFKSDNDVSTVYAKDVGTQIGWRLVYFIEYLGPILIQTLFYFFYYTPTHNTWTQILAYDLVLLHYLKREIETVKIHSFSADTMPLAYLFRNSGHYWIFSGLFIGFSIYAPESVRFSDSKLTRFIHHVADHDSETIAPLLTMWALFEMSNFYCHWILMKLRSDGSKEHKIPYGFLFEYVSFPNYFFEILSWLVFALLTNNWASWLFLVVGAVTMTNWALSKHKRYLKTFGDKYPKDRKAIIPFIL